MTDFINNIGFELENIGSYTIVYASDLPGYEHAANILKESIQKYKNCTLPVYRDVDCARMPREILIGRTNRPLSEKYYSDNGAKRIMTFEVIVESGDLQIACGGPYSAKRCIGYLEARLLPEASRTLKNGSYYRTFLTMVGAPLTGGADIRVMSSNVLCDRWCRDALFNPVLPATFRCEIFAGVLLRYRPDLIGAQELGEVWAGVLPYYLELLEKYYGLSYTYAVGKHNGVVNHEPLIYRSDRLEMLASGFDSMPYWDIDDCFYRGVAYAVLRVREADGKMIGIVNAHWNHTSEELMNTDAAVKAARMNTLMQTYPLVCAFATGDYNSHKFESRCLYRFVRDVNGAIASDKARENGTLLIDGGCRRTHSTMRDDIIAPFDDEFIDHIVCAGDYEVLRHDTVIYNCTQSMSDHSFIYADIALGKNAR